LEGSRAGNLKSPGVPTESVPFVPLHASVITSSSNLPLKLFLREIDAVHNVCTIDLSVFRDIDIEGIKERLNFTSAWDSAKQHFKESTSPLPDDPDDAISIARSLNTSNMRELVIDWLLTDLSDAEVKNVTISAYATYFPGISSMHDTRRDDAVDALAGTLLFALEMQHKMKEQPNPKYTVGDPIVEIVCGTVVETCRCDTCLQIIERPDANRGADHPKPCGPVFVYTPASKRERLIESLAAVTGAVEAKCASRRYGIALELEPGAVYVLGNTARLEKLCADISSYCVTGSPANQDQKVRICNHVGLNTDITHMLISKIPANTLSKFKSLILHAHISDGPHLHTRDQTVGNWTSVQATWGGYHDYLSLLYDCWAERRDTSGLPFSNAIALELEGCDRPSWIQHSFTAMKQLLLSLERRKNPQ
jgi:sugar phosphate isomerase/epimerase